MKKLSKYAILLILSLQIFTTFLGCGNKQKQNNSFDIDQFANQMKAKNYKFELKDVEKDFLPTTRKRMIIGKEAIDIYLYSSNKEVENDAKKINYGGCSYSNGTKSVNVSWSSYPHFYKKGTIIVQYVGENKKVISDLQDIFGEQFAGYRSDENINNNLNAPEKINIYLDGKQKQITKSSNNYDQALFNKINILVNKILQSLSTVQSAISENDIKESKGYGVELVYDKPQTATIDIGSGREKQIKFTEIIFPLSERWKKVAFFKIEDNFYIPIGLNEGLDYLIESYIK